MIFTGTLFDINFSALFFGVILSWYFGSIDSPIHPDKLIASVISYSEKALCREGTYKEGIIALLFNLAVVFVLGSVLLYFAKSTGDLWYFGFSIYFIYTSIDKRFTKTNESNSATVCYLNYALPVIISTLLLGPAGAILFRTLPLATSMLPVESDKYKEFSKPTDQTYTVLQDASILIIPLLSMISRGIKKLVRFIKSFRP
ncbi:MAG: hypothetical protein C0603_03980 [Denitrovibrio sp.]|nr:MAG: hypothetical protein C0603_03980 [Denitrovibrio sp.]